MSFLEVYTPAQIKACSQMLQHTFEDGRTLEEFLEFAKYLKDHTADIRVRNVRLVFKRKDVDITDSTTIMNSIGWDTLRSWQRIKKIIEKAGISPQAMKDYTRNARKAWLMGEPTGPRKP
jgi:hypothetical protein